MISTLPTSTWIGIHTTTHKDTCQKQFLSGLCLECDRAVAYADILDTGTMVAVEADGNGNVDYCMNESLVHLGWNRFYSWFFVKEMKVCLKCVSHLVTGLHIWWGLSFVNVNKCPWSYNYLKEACFHILPISSAILRIYARY